MRIKEMRRKSKKWKRIMSEVGGNSGLCGDLPVKCGHQIKEDGVISMITCFFEFK